MSDPTRPENGLRDGIEAGMSSRTSARIAVLKGGRSAEREVSLVSGSQMCGCAAAGGLRVVEIDAGPDLALSLNDAKPDVVFNALHGRWGEDGCVQGLLEWLRPALHPFRRAGLGAGDGQGARQDGLRRGRPAGGRGAAGARATRCGASHPMPPPYVVKPINEGSSVGVYLVHEATPTGRRRCPRTCRRRCWSRPSCPGAS